MIIYVQWAKANPEDWIALDITRNQQIRTAAKKAIPDSNSVLDNNPGWLLGANCQGLDFTGYDHVSIEVIGEGLRITGWQDDPEDFPPGTRYAIRWDLYPPAPDPKLNGILNTVQFLTVWAESEAAPFFTGINVLPWSLFVLPPSNQTFHGIWVTDQEFQTHLSLRSFHGWREWI